MNTELVGEFVRGVFTLHGGQSHSGLGHRMMLGFPHVYPPCWATVLTLRVVQFSGSIITQAFGATQNLDRHLVRPQNRHRLGRPARRFGLWLWQDLSPLSSALAPSRRLAATPCPVAHRTQWLRRDRLVEGYHRRLVCQGSRRWGGHRPEPHGSRQIRQQAP